MPPKPENATSFISRRTRSGISDIEPPVSQKLLHLSPSVKQIEMPCFERGCAARFGRSAESLCVFCPRQPASPLTLVSLDQFRTAKFVLRLLHGSGSAAIVLSTPANSRWLRCSAAAKASNTEFPPPAHGSANQELALEFNCTTPLGRGNVAHRVMDSAAEFLQVRIALGLPAGQPFADGFRGGGKGVGGGLDARAVGRK